MEEVGLKENKMLLYQNKWLTYCGMNKFVLCKTPFQ